MPNQTAVENFLRNRIAAAVAPRTAFAVGSLEDETLCLVREGDKWVVGYFERGKLRPEAWFANDVSAGEYMIFLLLRKAEGFQFPQVDWTGYAGLPG